MSEVRVKEGESLENALKRFKRSCAKAGVIADLLPATSFYLDKTFAPARRMVELGG